MKPEAKKHAGARNEPADLKVRVEKQVIIERPVEEVYGFWRNFENLPKFMTHLRAVTELDDRHSRWIAKGPAGSTVEWDAELMSERENELISWRSLENTEIEHAGSVQFRQLPYGRATEVTVTLAYNPPGGTLGRAFAAIFGDEPGQEVEHDLKRFKEIMESHVDYEQRKAG